MAFSWFRGKREQQPAGDGHDDFAADVAATICLRVEDGLLMAFGPEGDPIPPSLVRSICAGDPKGTLQMENGKTADRQRVLDLLDAQQKAPLADTSSDGWIEAMLCLGGAFEPTSARLLEEEAPGVMPSLPEAKDDEASAGRPDPETEIMTPLVFDDAERRSMAKADAIMIHGLQSGVGLTAGRHDPVIGGWVVRPKELPALAFQRRESAAKTAEIDVKAIAVDGKAKRWSVATRTIELA